MANLLFWKCKNTLAKMLCGNANATCGNEIVTKGALSEKSKTPIVVAKNKPFSYRLTYPRIHCIWSGMKNRCNSLQITIDIKTMVRGNYGICQEWQDSFERFANGHWKNGYAENNLTTEM